MDNTSTKESALAVSLSIQNDDWNKLDSLLDENFTYTGDGLIFNKDEYIGFMQDMKSALSGMKMEFKQVLVDGEYVTIHFTSRAKNTGKFMGAPATKKDIEVHGTLIRQMRDGKAIQEWQTTDLLGLMTQMGFGALLGYSIAVGLFKSKPKKPVRKS
ncbi:MAG: hypothetical protein RL637_303 [Pseudomonadota bacterium]|jgi:predicted ester cyclase